MSLFPRQLFNLTRLRAYSTQKTDIKIVEVGPRDGLQNEKQLISTETKLGLINGLIKAGVKDIEATAFVSPKWVPQMSDAKHVMEQIPRHSAVNYSVLVPNVKGLEAAMKANVEEIAIFGAASETFSKKNINASIEESLERFELVVEAALKKDIRVRGYISCALGCPYEGPIDPHAVADLALRLAEMGCYEISIADTIGVGTPGSMKRLLNAVLASVPSDKVAVHCHDTYGQALANIYAAYEMGIKTFDSSVAGLGGCPYAPGATGNVATEDVVYLMQGLGKETGIDLDKLVQVGNHISAALNRKNTSRVANALTKKKL